MDERQITDPEATVGKTVASFRYSVIAGVAAFHFTDGSYLLIKVELGWMEPKTVFNPRIPDRDQRELKIITQEEFDRRLAESQKIAEANLERYQRHEYERLKARFEPPPGGPVATDRDN